MVQNEKRILYFRYQTGTPVKLPTSSLANQFADGDYPAGMAQWTSTSVIGLYNVGDMKGMLRL